MEAELIRTQNVKKLINDYGYPKLVAMTGKSQSQLSQWATNAKNSRTKKPSFISRGSCRAIETALGLPTGWMDIDHSDQPGKEKHDVALMHFVPIRGYAKLGSEENYFVDLQYPNGDGSIVFPTKDRDAYAVKCDGDSMAPRIRHGEYAIIEPNTSVMPGDEVLIQSKDGQIMVKVFSHRREGRVYFESINNGYHKPFSLPEEEIESMHYVAGTAKSALRVEQ